MQIDIIYEDDGVLVINKPVGLMVHEDGVSEGETVVDWFLRRVPAARGVGEPGVGPTGKQLERSGIVHRLDRETSGVMVLAKTQAAFEHLKAQFHDRLVSKEYRAFVYGLMRERWGTIDRPIGRSASDFRKRSAERGAKGTLRPAVTDWECLKKGEYEGEAFSYLSLRPHTGRTHQLRVHLKAIDKPIVGDAVYAGKKFAQSNNLNFDRLALHAYQLRLNLLTEKEIICVAPIPESFTKAAQVLVEESDQ